jgi:hypothetical protein
MDGKAMRNQTVARAVARLVKLVSRGHVRATYVVSTR